MAIPNGGAVKSVQKLNGTIASTAYPQGSTLKTFVMPSFVVTDPNNAFIECFWWRRTAGTLSAIPAIFASVTDINEITVVVSCPVAMTLTIACGGKVIEYQ